LRRALRQRVPDQADQLFRQHERAVIVRLQIAEFEGPIAHFGEHAPLIRSEHLAVVIVDHRCPAGEQLIWCYTNVEKGLTLSRYWSSNCGACTMKAMCTPSKQRRITRWEHEAVIEAMQRRLDEMHNAMRVQRNIVEHVFGTIKDWMASRRTASPSWGSSGHASPRGARPPYASLPREAIADHRSSAPGS
jgi:hypothetical protein